VIICSWRLDTKVGGSLSGLFTGIALKRLGHDVRILERDNRPWLRHRGAGIIFGSDVQYFLQVYVPTKSPIVVLSDARHYLNRTGTIVDSQTCTQVMGSWDVLYHVLRAHFDGLASVYCECPGRIPGDGDAVYEFDRKVMGVEVEDGGDVVEVRAVSESSEMSVFRADLVIGADGPSSSVRRYLEPSVSRRYGGYVAWRGVVNEGDVSQDARDVFSGSFGFFYEPGTQALA
jgi:2-polyprenyl-6-methoxyphenol hydroxylase-like FAD-dependent oxidoreductase